MKRAIIFAHHNLHGLLSEYVLYWLEKLKPLADELIFVSNSGLSAPDKKKVEQVTGNRVIVDVGGNYLNAWNEVAEKRGWDYFQEFDSVTMMNDQYFGPLFDLKQLFEKMESGGADFWGITNRKPKHKLSLYFSRKKQKPVMSYFVTFRVSVLMSKSFRQFWAGEFAGKSRAIEPEKFEKRLTKTLLRNKYRVEEFIDLQKLNTISIKPLLYRPTLLINAGSPFIKRSGISLSREPRVLLRYLKEHTDYPTRLIEAYINETLSPNESGKVFNKNLLFPKKTKKLKKTGNKLSCAVHLHVYYPDVFTKIAKDFFTCELKPDFFITTDSDQKKTKIEEIISGFEGKMNVAEISVFGNRGRDIYPWFCISKKINEYDIAAHLHTKKSLYKEQQWIGETWMDHIAETMVLPADEIEETFRLQTDIGIIIPDVPGIMKKGIFGNHKKNSEHISKLWKRMDPVKSLDISKDLDFMIFPYGNMFWYRPKALNPLFEMNLEKEDFPAEPIPSDGTLPHAIERLPVYISWAMGYDFRIVLNPTSLTSSFSDAETFQRKIMKSTSLKIGKTITRIPSLIRKKMKAR